MSDWFRANDRAMKLSLTVSTENSRDATALQKMVSHGDLCASHGYVVEILLFLSVAGRKSLVEPLISEKIKMMRPDDSVKESICTSRAILEYRSHGGTTHSSLMGMDENQKLPSAALAEFVTLKPGQDVSNEVEMSFKVATNITSNQHGASHFEWHAVLRVLNADGHPVLECSDVSSPFTYVARPLKQQRLQLQLNDAITDGSPGDLLLLTGTHLEEPCVVANLTNGEGQLCTLEREGSRQPNTYVTRLPPALPHGVYKIQLLSTTEKLSCSRTRILRVGDDQQFSPMLQAHPSVERGVLPDCDIVAPPTEPIAISPALVAPFALNEPPQAMAKLPWKADRFEPSRACSLDVFCAQIESFIPPENGNPPPRARSEDIMLACKGVAVEPVEYVAAEDPFMAVDAVAGVEVGSPVNEGAANAAVALVMARTKSQEALGPLKRQMSL